MNSKSWPATLWRRLLGEKRSAGSGGGFPRFYDRRLERRRVLDAGPVGDFGSLLIDAGSGANDQVDDQFTITIRGEESAREIEVKVNGELTGTYSGEGSQSLQIAGSADHDTVVIQTEAPTTGAASSDSISTQSTVSYEFLDNGTTLQVTVQRAELDHDLVLTISNVEQVVDQLSAHQRQFVAQGDMQSLALSDNADPSDGLSLLQVNLETSVEFANPTDQLTLLAESTSRVTVEGSLQTAGHSLTAVAGQITVSGQLDTGGGDLRLVADHLEIASTATITVGQGNASLYGEQLNHLGEINASAESMVQLDSGTNGHLTVAGSIRATGNAAHETGGTVLLSGGQVELLGSATIDVSGQAGGGTILVGGGLRGTSAAVPNAEVTTVAEGAQLLANAMTEGDGGLIVVWSDRTTQYAGQIEARGGATGGKGGVAEVSGKQHLLYGGTVDLSAAQGEPGLLILDPATLTIVAGVAGADEVSVDDLEAAMADQMLIADISVVFENLADADDLIQLSDDVDLLVETVNAAGDAPGGIRFENMTDGIDRIAAGGDGNLIFTAGTDGDEEADITNYAHLTTDTGNIELRATGNISGLGDLTSTSGNIVLQADTNADAGGTISLGSSVQTTGGMIRLEAESLDIGTSTLDADAGTIEFRTGDFTLSNASTITASELVILSGASLAGSGNIGGSLRVADSGSTVAPGGSDPGRLTVDGDFTLEVDNSLSIQLDGTTAASEYDQLRVTGDVTLAGSLALSTGFTAGANDSFTIVELTTATSSVTSTFDGLAEGDTLTVNDQLFAITYAGGDGNDIVLSTVPARLSIAADTATQAEDDSGSTSFTFTVTRTDDTAGTDTATYTVTGTGANPANAADFTSGSLPTGTVSFADGEATQSITIMVAGDQLVELDEEFTVTLSAPSTGAVIDTATADATIENDDTAIVSVTGGTVAENDGPLEFTITLSHEVDTQVTVVLNTLTTGDAGADDFTEIVDQTVTFAAGTTQQTVNVVLSNENLVELDESLVVELSMIEASDREVIFAGNAATSTGSGTIENDDAAEISIVGGTANEGAEAVDYTISLSNPVDLDVMVTFQTTSLGGSASPGDDYTALADETIMFAAGTNADMTVTVTVVDDNLVEPTETINGLLNMFSAMGRSVTFAGGGMSTAALATITDNDNLLLSVSDPMANEAAGVITYEISLGNPRSEETTVMFETLESGTATAGDDFTPRMVAVEFMAGETTKTVDVMITNDQIVEREETIEARATIDSGLIMQTALGTGTITDNDQATVSIADATVVEGNSGTVMATFTVTLSHQVDAEVSFDADTVNGTASSAADDFTAVDASRTIAANSTAGTTSMLAVEVQGDNLVELDEAFLLRLSNLLADDLDVVFSSGDPTLDATGTITNDDTATVSIAEVAADEATGQLVFNVTLSNPVDTAITVRFDTLAGGSATVGEDFTALTDQLITFAANSTSATVTVVVAEENLVEADETVLGRIDTLMADSREVTLGTVNATGTITNDDMAEIRLVGGSADEADGVLQFTAQLTNPVDVPITVQFDTLATGSATPGVDFTAIADLPINFNANQTEVAIQVTIVDDAVVESNESVVAELNMLTPVGRALTFAGGTRSEATGLINNDDMAQLTIDSISQLEGTGGNSDFQFTVTLDSAVQGGFTAPFTIVDGSATDADDFDPVTLGPLAFAGNAGETQTITVRVWGDNTVEAEESFTVELNMLPGLDPTVADSITLSAPGQGTIENDDATVISIVAVPGSEVAEGDMGTTNMTFEVRLSNPTNQVVSVRVTSADGTIAGMNAIAGEDYTTVDRVLTFVAGSSGADLVQTVTVAVSSDLRYELDEVLSLNLSDPLVIGLNDANRATLGVATAAGTITNDDTDIIETGGMADDQFELTSTGVDAGSFVVTRGGVAGPLIPFTGVTSATFNGGAGNDQMVIRHTGADLFRPVGGIVFNGGAESGGGDQLQIIGGAMNDANVNLASGNEGTLNYDGVVATFNEVEIVDLLPQTLTNLTATFTGNTSDEIILEDEGTPANGAFGLSTDSGTSPSLQLTNPLTMFTIDSGAGDDTLTFESTFDSTTTAGSFQGGLAIIGGTGVDRVIFESSLALAGNDLTVNAELIEVAVVLNTANGMVVFDAAEIFMTDAAAIVSGTGSISLTAEGDIVVSSLNSQAAGVAIALESRTGAILDGGDMLLDLIAPSGTVRLRADAGVGNASILQTQVAAVDVTTRTGSIQIDDADMLQINGAHITGDMGAGNLRLSTPGTLVLSGGGTGISVMNNANVTLIAGDQLILENTVEADDILLAGNGRFVGRAAGQLMLPGAPTIRTQFGHIEGLPPAGTVNVMPAELGGPGVNVNTESEASLSIGLPAGSGFELLVDWNDFPQFGGPDRLAPVAGGTVQTAAHQYLLGNPTGNPTNNIPYHVQVEFAYIDASNNAIELFSQGEPLVLTASGELVVPVQGLQAFSIPDLGVNNQTSVLPAVAPPPVMNIPTAVDSATTALDFTTIVSEFTAAEVQRVELRLVTPSGDEIAVFEWARGNIDILQNLSELFEDLPDDRYRIYLIRVDGTEQLVVDVILRQHKPFDPLDEAEADRSRPPQYQGPLEQAERAASPAQANENEAPLPEALDLPAQLDRAPPVNSSPAVETSGQQTATPAVAAGAAVVATGHTLRHDQAQSGSPPPPVSFGKVARLARRVMRKQDDP